MKPDPRFSEENLRAALAGLDAAGADHIFPELSRAYADPARQYHTSAHIAECLLLLDRFAHLAGRPEEVELAIWFHDAVYDTERSDNEEASAVRARHLLSLVGVGQAEIDRIAEMIIATRTHESSNADCSLLLDIDLSILGAPPDEFEAYDQAIRREYAWVPEERYALGRTAILNSFLSRPRIYKTAEFFDIYERQARDNLRRKVTQLDPERPGS
jgi:predicted metal-dependent HD superfamily phosphohydrolase